MERVLLLLHPTVVTEPETVERVKSELEKNGAVIEQQIIDRVTKGHVEIAKNTYAKIVYVNPNTDKTIPVSMMKLLHDSLANDGSVSGDLPEDQNLDALMSGFVVDEDKKAWVKPAPVESVSIPLKKKTPGAVSGLKKLPMFKKLSSSPVGLTDSSAPNTDDENDVSMKRKLEQTKLAYFSESDEEDEEEGNNENEYEIYNENDLIKESTGSNLIIPKACELPNGKRRRKACKDCTCGLKEIEEQEDANQRSAQDSILGQTVQSATLEAIKIEQRLKERQQKIKFADEDLAEIDFTVEGKTGGCGSCALGDAFRCDGCPFLGLPPFKPGQVISIDSLGEDI